MTKNPPKTPANQQQPTSEPEVEELTGARLFHDRTNDTLYATDGKYLYTYPGVTREKLDSTVDADPRIGNHRRHLSAGPGKTPRNPGSRGK